jgi:hypothetical protein
MSGIEDSGWRSNLIEGWEGVRQVLAATKRVAVLGIRSEQHTGPDRHSMYRSI